jgi:hypothetical protein
MEWYDWVLWILVLYMTVGSDFGLNWLTGISLGKRIDKNSTNIFNKIYYYIWASTDPMAGPVDRGLVDDSGVTAPVNKKPIAPAMVALCQMNAVITVSLEVLILIGMFTHGPYLRPAVFMFVFRGLLEIVYASQLIWGKGGVRGWALVSYLIIGFIPQTLAPFLLAMRFATSIEPDILWWQPFIFLGLPYGIFIWTSIVSYNNQGVRLKDYTA